MSPKASLPFAEHSAAHDFWNAYSILDRRVNENNSTFRRAFCGTTSQTENLQARNWIRGVIESNSTFAEHSAAHDFGTRTRYWIRRVIKSNSIGVERSVAHGFLLRRPNRVLNTKDGTILVVPLVLVVPRQNTYAFTAWCSRNGRGAPTESVCIYCMAFSVRNKKTDQEMNKTIFLEVRTGPTWAAMQLSPTALRMLFNARGQI